MWNLYKRSRLIHINLNIAFAALAGIALSSVFVYLTHYVTNDTRAIVILSYLFDGFLDIAIFATLHFALYHRWLKHHAFAKMIAKDLILIQTHRLILSIVVTTISLGGHWWLITQGLGRTRAFIIAYTLAVLTARVLHTIYGLKTGLFKSLEEPERKKSK